MDNPGPGTYNPAAEKESRLKTPQKFIITNKPFIDYDNKVPGPCKYEYENTIRTGVPHPPSYSMHVRPPPPHINTVPGPGAYDPDVLL